MRTVIVISLLSEVAYVASVRILLHSFHGSFLEREVWWTVLRLLSAAVLTFLYVRLMRATPSPARRIPVRCAFATGIFLAPILVGHMGLAGPARYAFAAASFAVGLREELAYRGILQRILTPRVGIVTSLCVSNLLFVLYHWGIQPFALHYVIQIILCGIILGLVYHLSGSILLVVGLHSIYDAIDCFTPFLKPRFPDHWSTVVLSLTLVAILVGHGMSVPVRSEKSRN
jgi:membrane protease YdiL (CAAX protease family)